MCHQGAGYGAASKIQQGFINVASQLDHMMDECPPLDTYSEIDLDDHITGVVLALHYSHKNGIGLLGDKAEQATTKEFCTCPCQVKRKIDNDDRSPLGMPPLVRCTAVDDEDGSNYFSDDEE